MPKNDNSSYSGDRNSNETAVIVRLINVVASTSRSFNDYSQPSPSSQLRIRRSQLMNDLITHSKGELYAKN